MKFNLVTFLTLSAIPCNVNAFSSVHHTRPTVVKCNASLPSSSRIPFRFHSSLTSCPFKIESNHQGLNFPLHASISDKDTNQVDNNKIISDAFETQNTLTFTEPVPYEKITIAVMKETYPGENRVSISPNSAETLIKAGFHVIVEQGGETFIRIYC
jgi:hypothetical protein